MNPLQQIADNLVAWAFEQEEYGEWVTRLSLSREAGEGDGKRNLRPLYAHPSRGVVDGLCERLQQKCSDWGTYWRAPDAHGVNLSMDQALELLRDALGVEVDIAQAAALPSVPDDLLRLQEFAASIIGDEIGDVDGGQIQDTATGCGLLIPTEVSEPCDAGYCACAEVGDFPMNCYRYSPTLIRAFKAAKKAATPAHDQPEGSDND